MDNINSSKKIDFDEVARIINSDFDAHKKIIHKCCVKASIIPLSEYYEALQKEYQTIENCTTPRKNKPDPLEYIDLFKAFEEYPANLPKPKKQTARENARFHTTIKSKANSSSSSINSSKIIEDQPSAAAICNEFSKFTEKLETFKKEIEDQSSSKQYNDKLECINTFARELNKLSQAEEVGNDAFTEEEEAKIKQISENVEHFAFIQENQDLYSNTSTSNEVNTARLNDLVDIVTDALLAVNCYKP